MSIFTKVARHARLVERMAERQGAPMDADLSENDLRAANYRSAVLRCCACKNADACENLPASRAQSVPSYCRNKGFFGGLNGRA